MPTHPWKARLSITIIMLVLAFIGVVVSDVHINGGWIYWKWIVPVYALLALWLSWYTKKKRQVVSPISIIHEILHWIGLILAIFLISHLVKMGIMSRFLGGIFDIVLLSLAVFLAGIYIEHIFILVGIVLGFFALFTAMISQYIYAITIPIIIGAIIIIIMYLWMYHKKYFPKKY